MLVTRKSRPEPLIASPRACSWIIVITTFALPAFLLQASRHRTGDRLAT